MYTPIGILVPRIQPQQTATSLDHCITCRNMQISSCVQAPQQRARHGPHASYSSVFLDFSSSFPPNGTTFPQSHSLLKTTPPPRFYYHFLSPASIPHPPPNTQKQKIQNRVGLQVLLSPLLPLLDSVEHEIYFERDNLGRCCICLPLMPQRLAAGNANSKSIDYLHCTKEVLRISLIPSYGVLLSWIQ